MEGGWCGELLPPVGPTSVGRIGELAATSGKPVAAKYRDPATGATWSGRGRLPHWLTDELAKGRKREEFEALQKNVGKLLNGES